MNNYGTFTTLSPLSLLRHLSSSFDSTCLQALSNSVTWSIFINQGKIIYATHSVEPFDRLERHLRRLSNRIPTLTNEIRVQLRLIFEPESYSQSTKNYSNFPELPPDYQAIYWLINQNHIDPTQAAVLIQELATEVIESFLLIKQCNYELKETLEIMPIICKLDIAKITKRCQNKLQFWYSLAPHISSPYQRPYPRIKAKIQQDNLSDIDDNFLRWMRGFSLRHLAVMMNKDEIQLVKRIYPYIVNGVIVLHEPDPPFDTLPKLFEPISQENYYFNQVATGSINTVSTPTQTTTNNTYKDEFTQTVALRRQQLQQLTGVTNNPGIPKVASAPTKAPSKYKILSVDDSPTFLKEISRFLEDENFSVVTINNPLQAVMAIIRHKPDLILLDLNMEGIDGYELCRMIRNNSMFKNTPIVMVTGNKGFVDKVKARLVGASGYLTKPFTRADLLKMIFTHLT